MRKEVSRDDIVVGRTYCFTCDSEYTFLLKFYSGAGHHSYCLRINNDYNGEVKFLRYTGIDDDKLRPDGNLYECTIEEDEILMLILAEYERVI